MSSSVATAAASRIALVFAGMPPALRQTLEDELNDPNATHPFRGLTEVECISHPVGIVFRLNGGQAGYSFCRNTWGAENDAATFRHFLHDPIQSRYLHIPYETKEATDGIVSGILERYQNYGAQHAAKIDWIWYQRERSSGGKHLLILRVPKEIVEAMMSPHSGVLTTTVVGTAAALRQLPVLSQIVPAEAVGTERLQRAFVTQYAEGPAQRAECMAIHQAAVREVVAAANQGICIGPVAVWSP